MNPTYDFSGQLAFVTGGASGVCDRWRGRGAGGRERSGTGRGGRGVEGIGRANECDVADEAQVRDAVNATIPTLYHAAKHGIHGITKSAGLEYAARHPRERGRTRDHGHADGGEHEAGRSRRHRGDDAGCADQAPRSGQSISLSRTETAAAN